MSGATSSSVSADTSAGSADPHPGDAEEGDGGFVTLDHDSIRNIPHFDHVKVTLIARTVLEGMQGNGNAGKRGCASRGLIMHFHGGGFVSSTSKTHESYLKEWASELNAPVLSVDYSLSPQHQYPRALNECFYCYVWALVNCNRLGWSGQRICLTGDSAGGNLAVAVALKAITENVRIPDGIVLAYPALNVGTSLSPSRLVSLFDPILPQEILLSCLEAYHPHADGAGSRDPLLSPLYAEESLLRRLPRVSIAAVLLDPLLDDSVVFAKRLKAAGAKKVRLQVFEELSHGFLMFAALNETSRIATRTCAAWIKEVFDKA